MENDSWFPPCAIARSTAANNQSDVVRRRRVSVAGMLSVRRLFQRLLPKLRGHNVVESGNEIAFHPTVFAVPGVEIVPDECHRILGNSPLSPETFVKGFRELLVHRRIGRSLVFLKERIRLGRERPQTLRVILLKRRIESVKHGYARLVTVCLHKI